MTNGTIRLPFLKGWLNVRNKSPPEYIIWIQIDAHDSKQNFPYKFLESCPSHWGDLVSRILNSKFKTENLLSLKFAKQHHSACYCYSLQFFSYVNYKKQKKSFYTDVPHSVQAPNFYTISACFSNISCRLGSQTNILNELQWTRSRCERCCWMRKSLSFIR